MRAALAVAGVELRRRLRDRSAVLAGFVAPALLASIASAAFGSGFGRVGDLRVTVAVADLDASALSRSFVAQTLGSAALRERLTVEMAPSQAEVLGAVERGTAAAGLVIPRGFGAAVSAGQLAAASAGQPASVTVVRSAAQPLAGEIVQAIAASFLGRLDATSLAVATVLRSGGARAEEAGRLAVQAAFRGMPLQLTDQPVTPVREVSGANYFAPAMAILFLYMGAGAAARGLGAERRHGTLPRMLAGPVGAWSVLAGKALATVAIGLAAMGSVLAITGALLGADWGDPAALVALCVLTVLSVTSVTALVQTLARSEQEASAYGSMAGLLLSLAGGSFFPLFQLPPPLQRVSALTPNGWALRGFADLAYDGARLADLLPNLAAMAAFAAGCGTLAALRARRMAGA